LNKSQQFDMGKKMIIKIPNKLKNNPSVKTQHMKWQ